MDDYYFVCLFALLRGAYDFANELACLAAGNIQNEGVTVYRSQEVLKMLSLYA
jgi:hypothetical protein